ncbi:unnamed protein product [Bursaphelenchus okinawaensis]|uniref:Piwi domain-containing protein n=1 Tax=Bursaphelenchus okinawaensis TaxID=465554 RepID=A0A811LFG5_9BILA|nr:unnamed protein product [Bursaphelenchus okinawaensis]CAG9122143.1 unnamed protein product [Bursaphelenchus okinawaensis]
MSGGKTTLNPNKNLLTEKTKIENEAVELLRSLEISEGSTELMPKPEPGKAGKPIQVLTNIYAVKIPEKEIFRYDVTISGIAIRNRKEVEFSKKSEESIVIADRVTVCRAAWREIFRLNSDLFGTNIHRIYYDLQSTLYSLFELPIEKDSKELAIPVSDIEDETIARLFAGIGEIRILIKKAVSNRIQLNDLTTIHNPETGRKDRSIMNIIELMVNQVPMFNENQFLTLRGSSSYVVDAERFGLPECPLDDGGTKFLAAGVKRSACFIEGWEGCKPAVGMMLETRRSPFHSTLNLIDYIRRYGPFEGYYNSFISGHCTDNALRHISSVLRNMTFVVEHRRARKIEISTFVAKNAQTHMIEQRSLEEYLFERYGQRLRFPCAHLATVKVRGQHMFYPPEHLMVADNQLVLEKQMEAREKANMIRIAAVRPDVLQDESVKGARAIQLHDSPYTGAADVRFSKTVMKVNARQLPMPKMVYAKNAESQQTRGEAAWRQLPFIRGARIEAFSMYVVGTAPTPCVFQPDQKRLVQSLQTSAKSFGMDIGKLADTAYIYDNEVDEKIRLNKENGVNFVYFISPDSIKSAHDFMKNAEHKYAVATQDIRVNTVKKILQRAGATLENVIAKTNLKLGGVNFSVKSGTPEVQAQLEKTLFIGISNSQPGSKTAVDKAQTKNRKNEKPGVLGYCANICEDKDTFAGDFMYIDAYRNEIYKLLVKINERCVKYFTENRGHPPENVVFYYAGVAEGQFDNILKLCVPLMKEGIRRANNNVDIPLCVISVQKVNNLTLFPTQFPPARQDSRDHEFNVLPGTVVDTKIVHPLYAQFFLVPHTAIKGSAKVPRFSVLLNEPQFTMDTIEGFSNALCYEHQIVARATALPTPLMVAEDYANRGRHVFLAADYEEKQGYFAYPRLPDGNVDLEALTELLSYERCPELRNRRVNA